MLVTKRCFSSGRNPEECLETPSHLILIPCEKTGIAFIEVGSRKCRDFWRHPVLLLSSQDAQDGRFPPERMDGQWMGLNSQHFKKSFDLAKFRPVFLRKTRCSELCTQSSSCRSSGLCPGRGTSWVKLN